MRTNSPSTRRNARNVSTGKDVYCKNPFRGCTKFMYMIQIENQLGDAVEVWTCVEDDYHHWTVPSPRQAKRRKTRLGELRIGWVCRVWLATRTKGVKLPCSVFLGSSVIFPLSLIVSSLLNRPVLSFYSRERYLGRLKVQCLSRMWLDTCITGRSTKECLPVAISQFLFPERHPSSSLNGDIIGNAKSPRYSCHF